MSDAPRSTRLAPTIGLAIIAALIVFHGNDFGHRFLGMTAGSKAAQAIDTAPNWYWVIPIARGSIAQEAVIRSYLIERVREPTGSRMLAVTDASQMLL